MVDITQPSFLGFTITPWLIILFLSFIGALIFAVSVVSGFSKRNLKEIEIIEKAAKNTSVIPVRTAKVQSSSLSTENQDGTELISYDETEKIDLPSSEEQGSETVVLETEVL